MAPLIATGPVVLDASVLIAHLDGTDVHHERASGLLANVAARRLAISQITLAEVLVGPARAGKLDRAVAAVQQLGVAPIAFADDAPTRLAQLRAGTQVRMPDCCVLLAAHQATGDVATFDERLGAAGRARGLVVIDE